jgi:hypothetical protein
VERLAAPLADLATVAPSVQLAVVLAPRLATSALDLVDLRRAGPLLAFEVARHGMLLYERDPSASW